MLRLSIYWKDERKQQNLTVAGVDFDPSGLLWYYLEDPNNRIEVRRDQYCWVMVQGGGGESC